MRAFGDRSGSARGSHGRTSPLASTPAPRSTLVQLQGMVDASARVESTRAWQAMADASPGSSSTTMGLPSRLRAGVERLSGLAMDDVRVHYGSAKPARLPAFAYTQGRDIYLGPGQERHLPHEAWHVVQQKQGRVQPTMQAAGLAGNDDRSLEGEADRMGEKAASLGESARPSATVQRQASSTSPVQGKVVQLKGPDPYNIFAAVIGDMRDRGDEDAAIAKIRAALSEWDASEKYAFLKYLPEKYHRLALAAGMDLMVDEDELTYGKGLLVEKGKKAIRMDTLKPFYKWLYETEDIEPDAMNCWETVLYAAFKVGKLDKARIKALIVRVGGATKLARDVIASADGKIVKTSLSDGGEGFAPPTDDKYFIQDAEVDDLSIPAGKVIIFGHEGQHVALSAGGTHIYENDSEPGNLVRSTIQAALARNRREYGVALHWGDLPK